MTREIVPGMAEAIERRRKELGLSPGDLAEESGLSRTGIADMRKGYRKLYQDGPKLRVCRALQWTPDSIDRLLNGLPPIVAEPSATPVPSGRTIEQRLAAIEEQLSRLADVPAGIAELLDSVRDLLIERDADESQPPVQQQGGPSV